MDHPVRVSAPALCHALASTSLSRASVALKPSRTRVQGPLPVTFLNIPSGHCAQSRPAAARHAPRAHTQLLCATPSVKPHSPQGSHCPGGEPWALKVLRGQAAQAGAGPAGRTCPLAQGEQAEEPGAAHSSAPHARHSPCDSKVLAGQGLQATSAGARTQPGAQRVQDVDPGALVVEAGQGTHTPRGSGR